MGEGVIERDEREAQGTSVGEADSVSAHCPKCDYDLSGLLESESRRCPECGSVWSIEELALQRVASLEARWGLGWWLWIAAPVPIACGLVVMGLMLRPIAALVAAVAVGAYAVFKVIDWWRTIYRRSFARGRSRGNRVSYMLRMLAMLIAINATELLIIFAVTRMVQASITGDG